MPDIEEVSLTDNDYGIAGVFLAWLLETVGILQANLVLIGDSDVRMFQLQLFVRASLRYS